MATKEKGHELSSLIAITLQIIEVDGCYIAPPKTGTAPSTYSKTLTLLQSGNPLAIDDDYFRLADEIIKFFQELPAQPEYKNLMERSDSAMYQTFIDVATQNEILPNNIMFAVMMPSAYGKLRPRKATEQIKIEEAPITPTHSFMGSKDTPNRFFVKLVAIGPVDQRFNGNRFEVRDRNNNIGYFFEKAEKLRHILYLGDCFAMIATPMRHETSPIGDKETIFRTIEIVENKGPGKDVPPPSQDTTGLFTRS